MSEASVIEGEVEKAAKKITYGGVLKETAAWLTVKPVKAVWNGTGAALKSTAGKIGLGTVSVAGAGLGVKDWHDKRNERYAAQQADKAYDISQQIVDKQNQIAAVQAQLGNPDAATNNVAKVEAAKQQQAQSEISLS